jgi:succinate-acetate transporter protein
LILNRNFSDFYGIFFVFYWFLYTYVIFECKIILRKYVILLFFQLKVKCLIICIVFYIT